MDSSLLAFASKHTVAEQTFAQQSPAYGAGLRSISYLQPASPKAGLEKEYEVVVRFDALAAGDAWQSFQNTLKTYAKDACMSGWRKAGNRGVHAPEGMMSDVFVRTTQPQRVLGLLAEQGLLSDGELSLAHSNLARQCTEYRELHSSAETCIATHSRA